jgi:hypothetical protein
MKRNLLICLALLAVSWGVAAGSTLSDARRCNGDPDEFQARQVLDEGITLERAALDAGPGRGGAAAEETRRPALSSRARAYRPSGRGRLAVTLSGKHIFLEK